jgi:excisionase family DNA binding protein
MSVAVAPLATEAQTWTIEQVCEYLHCGRSTLMKWIREGRVPGPSQGPGRRKLWDPAAIQALVSPQSSEAATAAR